MVMRQRFPQNKLYRWEGLRVTPDQATALAWASRATGLSKSELLRRALLDYLDRLAAS